MVIDALLCIGIPVWYRTRVMPFSGLPLLTIVLLCIDTLGVLPASMNTYAWPNMQRLCALFVSLDALQTLVHIPTHHGWLGVKVREHHLIHHRHKRIHPASAFDTGCLDALLQLIIPLMLTLALVQPDRTTAIAFGVLYSQWLIHIHTPTDACGVWRVPVVTLAYHQAHHSGGGHYAHIFAVC
jgi:hypothetical protein